MKNRIVRWLLLTAGLACAGGCLVKAHDFLCAADPDNASCNNGFIFPDLNDIF